MYNKSSYAQVVYITAKQVILRCRNVQKMKSARTKRTKAIAFHCQMCKFVTLLFAYARFPNSRPCRENRLCRLKRASRGEKTTDAIEAILAIPWFPLNRLYRIKR